MNKAVSVVGQGREITDLDVKEVSLVDKAANGKKFSIIKQEDAMPAEVEKITCSQCGWSGEKTELKDGKCPNCGAAVIQAEGVGAPAVPPTPPATQEVKPVAASEEGLDKRLSDLEKGMENLARAIDVLVGKAEEENEEQKAAEDEEERAIEEIQAEEEVEPVVPEAEEEEVEAQEPGMQCVECGWAGEAAALVDGACPECGSAVEPVEAAESVTEEEVAEVVEAAEDADEDEEKQDDEDEEEEKAEDEEEDEEKAEDEDEFKAEDEEEEEEKADDEDEDEEDKEKTEKRYASMTKATLVREIYDRERHIRKLIKMLKQAAVDQEKAVVDAVEAVRKELGLQ